MALELGQRVGDYEVLALLGSGGMGRVYKVRNIISNREEAMKILLPDFASEPELAARFMVEIRTLAGLEHPNIAQLRTAFQFQNQFVMIMEYVEGAGLDKLAESRPPLDQVLEYSSQVLSALSYAHTHGVTHRDIKPANIMITSHGLVKLMDFGIAKGANDLNLTRPGMTMGSVYYMSPEQVRGGAVDARSDIYSFGVTLYEMLTGRKPFQADTSFTVLNAQLNEAPTPPIQVNPTLPPQLNAIVLRAMEKQPEARFQTADEFRNALKALREPLAAQPAPLPPVQTPEFGYAPGAPPPFAATQPPAQSPGFAPVPMPPAPATQGTGKSRRGLWIAMGALAAILALVAVATVLPRVFATHAGSKPATTAQDTQTAAVTPPAATPQQISPSPDPAQQPNPLSTSTATPAPAASAMPASQPAPAVAAPPRPAYTRHQPASVSNPQPQAAAPAPSQPAVPAAPSGPSPQEIRQARNRLMNLGARADAAQSGVEQIRHQQQAQGLDIRGDILASMSRMNADLTEANHSLDQNDLQSAKEYMQRADHEISTLESFLGR
jgi:eukaryotic-like serine/threonine-protein kinase